MTNEIKDLMKKTYRNGETEGTKVHKLENGSAIVIVRDEHLIIAVGHVYANGSRVKYPSFVGSGELVSKLIAEFSEENAEDLEAGMAIEELTNDKSSCFNKENQTGRSNMDQKVQDTIRNIVATGKDSGKTGDGVEFEVKQSAGVRKVRLGDSYFTAIGTKRVRILKSTEKEFNEVVGKSGKAKSAKAKAPKKSKEPRPAQEEVKCEECGEMFMRSKFAPNQTKCSKCKPRRGGEVKPAKITVKCETCGKDFETSKFNPNAKQCPDCKPRRAKGESKPVEPRKCEVTGEMFTPSKFNPNATVSPEGLKVQKIQKARDGRIAEALKKIEEQKVAEGIEVPEIEKALAKAWDNEGIHAIPSLVKAVRVHFDVKIEKKAEVNAEYEASDEDQEASK